MKKLFGLFTLLLTTVAWSQVNGINGVYINGQPLLDLTSSGITGTLPLDHVAFQSAGHELWVDSKRTDTFTPDGSYLRPYLTVLAAVNAVNADVLVHAAAGTGAAANYVIHVGSGTYSDNLTITGPRYLRIEGGGVTLSGTILINSGVGSYDKIEFVGSSTAFTEKGPSMTLSGAMTLTRTNDSLIYVGFKGCYITGNAATDTDGTWVLMYDGCRVNGTITGTFSTSGHPQILLISRGWNEFAGTISGKLAFYDAMGSDFYGTINTTPHYASKFRHCSFSGSITVAPTATPDSTLIYVDESSNYSFMSRTPTLTGATLSLLSPYVAVGIRNFTVAATADLTAQQVNGGIISNYGQTVANTMTLPAAAVGYNCIVVVGTAGAGAVNVKAGASDKLYLDGVALDDGDKAALATPAVGNMLTCLTFQTGASAYDWICTSGGGSAWTDGGA